MRGWRGWVVVVMAIVFVFVASLAGRYGDAICLVLLLILLALRDIAIVLRDFLVAFGEGQRHDWH